MTRHGPAGAWPELPARATESLNRLLKGNARFRDGRSRHPHESMSRRRRVESGQEPVAAFFGCVDSRVPDEVVLDQGLGDLFTIRTAAHVLDTAALASLEFGVHRLDIPLIMVLGHQSCGAVTAAIDAVDGGVVAPGAIGALVEAIRPAVEATNDVEHQSARLEAAVRFHTRSTAADLVARSLLLADAVDDGRVGVVAAWYSLHTGEIAPA